jgi:hypothetical protein
VSAREPAPLTRFERVCLSAALALTLALLVPLRHYITDDTFIHLQYARRLAEGHGLVFNVGERVYGCTSPFWVALLAAGMTLGLPGLAVARALGMIAALGSVVLFFQLARRTLATPAFRGLATVAWAGHAWMLRWAVSGMEHRSRWRRPPASCRSRPGASGRCSPERCGRSPRSRGPRRRSCSRCGACS